MRKAGAILARILRELSEQLSPGMSTLDLDSFAESRCKDLGVKPLFKGYHGFPGSVCISVNEEVVHGIPSAQKIIQHGDLVSLDFGVLLDGWCSDSARTERVGFPSLIGDSFTFDPEDKIEQLRHVTYQSLLCGIEACQLGKRIVDIGTAVQNKVESSGFSVVREFVGHGIGRALHEAPQVPNYKSDSKGPRIELGMVLAIEPMVNMGGPGVKVLSDGWTAVTRDGMLSAHFEHTVAVTKTGPLVLSTES